VKPTVLIAASSHWFPTARLAMALTSAGCVVDAVCPARHPLSTVRAVRRTHRYSGLAPLYSLSRAIQNSGPDLIIPGDDLTTRHLHHLYRRERTRGNDVICNLIERSFGSPESFPIVYERATFMQLASAEGVRVPKTTVITNLQVLRRWIEETGFPCVLKADGTSGGDGVKIVRNLEQAADAYRKLNAPPMLARAAKRALMDRDKTLVWPSLLRRRSVVSAQALVVGHEATSTVACWRGAVLAALHFEVVNKKCASGPATVMRLADHQEMKGAVEKMVRRLNLSGVHGFDFMIEGHTGDAYLIEINPRTTQVGHLRLGEGRDLPAALIAALAHCPIQHAPKLTENTMIALFPQEWMRDPGSSFMYSAYHDVPWEEPALLQLCLQSSLKLKARDERSANPHLVDKYSKPGVTPVIKPELKKSANE
jgi:Carbamoyl-phosphate synthase L chain, ATP binding domain